VKQDDGAIWSILADAKGKGAEKHHDNPDLSRSRHKTLGKGKAKEIQFNRTPSRPRVWALDPLPDDWGDSISQAGDPSPFPSRSGHTRSSRKRPSASGDMESISMNGDSHPGSARKKRRLVADDDVSQMPPPTSIPNGRSSRRLRDDSRHLPVSADPRTRSMTSGYFSSTRASRHANQQSASYTGHTGSASPTKSGITRIKLIVRKPPPLISHPRQRPPAPRFGSLDKFLSSYTTFNDQDLTEEALEGMAKVDSIILDRIEDFRGQGRLLLPDLDSESGSRSGIMRTATGTTHKRGPDIWDQVIEEVIARARVKRNGNGIGGRGQVALQVASRIQGYWDGHALREDKAKVQEERRLRALAKATIKMVTGEWKKAVFVRFHLHLQDTR